jgi:hypothetical protein
VSLLNIVGVDKGKKKQGKKETLHVVLKKIKSRVKGATEMRDAEIHMNQRLQVSAPCLVTLLRVMNERCCEYRVETW